MFYIKSKSRKVNLLFLSVAIVGVMLIGISKYNPSSSIQIESNTPSNITEAKWDGTFSGLFSIHFGRKGSGHGKIVLFGFVLYDGQNHK